MEIEESTPCYILLSLGYCVSAGDGDCGLGASCDDPVGI